MNRQQCKLALECFCSVTMNYLPDVLEPFGVYGKALGSLIKMIRDGTAKFKEAEFARKKEEAVEQVKEIADKQKPPKFADGVIFTCKRGVALNEQQQDLLRSLFAQELQDLEEVCQLGLNEFAENYMGASINTDCGDECQIGSTYLNFTFCDECGSREIPYGDAVKKDMDSLMGIVNKVLGATAFDYYLVVGHDESWFD